MNFSQEDLKNLAILISKAPIVGSEALTVAMLLHKINTMTKPETPVEEAKEEEKK